MNDLIEQAHGGVGLRHITKPKLESVVLALPPLAEQHRIVARVDELMALCDRLDERLVTMDDTRRPLLNAMLHEALYTDVGLRAGNNRTVAVA